MWKIAKTEGKVKVYDVVIETESNSSYLKFSNIEELALINPNIITLTAKLQSQLKNVTMLSMWDGTIPTVHVAPQFKAFKISSCSTSKVVIDPNVTYETVYFAVVFDILKQLPKHLNSMKKLIKLELYQNHIEYVDMADFNGLNDLEHINLGQNKIIQVSENPIVLPDLKMFLLHENNLSYINFENWNATSLQNIRIERNQLLVAFGISIAFPRLRKVSLYANSFNCEWLNATLEELKTSSVSIEEENLTTCSENKMNSNELFKIMFHHKLVNKQQLLLQKQIESTKQELDTEDAKLKGSVQVLKQEIESLKRSQQTQQELEEAKAETLRKEIDGLKQLQTSAFAEIEQLKHKNDDLIEELYLQAVASERDQTESPIKKKKKWFDLLK